MNETCPDQTGRTIGRRLCLPMAVLLVIIAGCAVQKTPAPPPVDVDPGLALAENYTKAGQKAEQSGQLVAARRDYRLALTASPGYAPAADKYRFVESRLTKMADIKYHEAQSALTAGKSQQAERLFIAALSLKPDHREALDSLLKMRAAAAEPFASHTVSEGESLSSVVQRYYGDADAENAMDRVRQANGLSRKSAIRPGQTLKLPFILVKENIRPDLARVSAEKEPATPYGTEEEDAQSEADANQANYGPVKDLLKQGRYAEAAAELDKAHNNRPDDPEIIRLLCEAQIHQSLSHFKTYQADPDQVHHILDAESIRSRFLKLAQNHPICDSMRRSVAATDYDQAMKLLDMERPDAERALLLLEQVRFLDSAFKDIDQIIEDTKSMRDKLENRGGDS